MQNQLLQEIIEILDDLGIQSSIKIKLGDEKVYFKLNNEDIYIYLERRTSTNYDIWHKGYFYSLGIEGHDRGMSSPSEEKPSREKLEKEIMTYLKIKKPEKVMTLFDFI